MVFKDSRLTLSGPGGPEGRAADEKNRVSFKWMAELEVLVPDAKLWSSGASLSLPLSLFLCLCVSARAHKHARAHAHAHTHANTHTHTFSLHRHPLLLSPRLLSSPSSLSVLSSLARSSLFLPLSVAQNTRGCTRWC